MTSSHRAARTSRPRRSASAVREALLLAAESEFKRSGYTGATTASIARRAKTTEAQLFRYFPTKSALFRAAVQDSLNAHLVAFTDRVVSDGPGPVPTERQAVKYIEELQRFILEHERMFVSLVTTEAYRPDNLEGVDGVDALHAYFDRGAAMMRMRTGDSVKLAPELMVRVSFAAVLACTIFRHPIRDRRPLRRPGLDRLAACVIATASQPAP